MLEERRSVFVTELRRGSVATVDGRMVVLLTGFERSHVCVTYFPRLSREDDVSVVEGRVSPAKPYWTPWQHDLLNASRVLRPELPPLDFRFEQVEKQKKNGETYYQREIVWLDEPTEQDRDNVSTDTEGE